jgi:hypothetical protein
VFTITDTVGRAFGITDAKKLAKVPLVMVRWTDYSPVHASWEPLENMSQAVVQDHVQPLQGRLDVEAGTIMQELEVELVADIILMCRRLASRPSLSGTAFIPVPQQVYAVGIWRRVCWAHRCGARDVCKSQSGGAVPVEVTAKFSTLSAFWAVVLPGSTPSGAVYEDTVSRCSLLLAPHGQVLRRVFTISILFYSILGGGPEPPFPFFPLLPHTPHRPSHRPHVSPRAVRGRGCHRALRPQSYASALCPH